MKMHFSQLIIEIIELFQSLGDSVLSPLSNDRYCETKTEQDMVDLKREKKQRLFEHCSNIVRTRPKLFVIRTIQLFEQFNSPSYICKVKVQPPPPLLQLSHSICQQPIPDEFLQEVHPLWVKANVKGGVGSNVHVRSCLWSSWLHRPPIVNSVGFTKVGSWVSVLHGQNINGLFDISCG